MKQLKDLIIVMQSKRFRQQKKKVLTWGAFKETCYSEQYTSKYFTAALEQSLKLLHIHAFQQMMTYSKTSLNTVKFYPNYFGRIKNITNDFLSLRTRNNM